MEHIAVDKLAILDLKDLSSKAIEDLFGHSVMKQSGGTIFCVENGNIFKGIISVGDYKRYLSSHTEGQQKLLQCINTSCQLLSNGDDIWENANVIRNQYPNIKILPIIDKKTKIICGAIKLFDRKYTYFNEVIELFYIRAGAFEEFCEKNSYNEITVCGNDSVTLLLALHLIKNLKFIRNVYVVSSDEDIAWQIFHQFGYNCSVRNEHKTKLIFYLDEDCYFKDSFSVNEFIEKLDIFSNERYGDVNVIRTSNDRKHFLIPHLDAIKKKYGISIHFVGIPLLTDLSLNNKPYFCIPFYKISANDLSNEINHILGNMCLVDDLKKTILTKQTDLYAYSCNGKQITLRNGKRWIPNRDLNANKRIYLIGPCITAGRYTDDHNTVGFFLQEKLYGCGYEVHMLNASPDWGNYMKWLGHIKVRKGDVIIFIDVWKRLHQIDLDMRESFQNAYDSYGQFFLDTPVHCNHIGHKVLAEEIYSAFFSDKIFNDTIETDSVPRTYISEFHKDIPLVFCGNPELEKYKEYLRSIKTDCKGTIGAIVMNCNPFTLGHRYLIEYAHDQVDFLYIFVVQEDRSNFSFKERMEFVKKGTADLDRIMVLPSGKFIISADTFSEYFVKGMAKSGNVDTSLDVETFAQHIAPILNISVRFLGEEPFDPITLQYNQDMLEILPDYGIKVDVISRKEIAGEKISASKVRKLLDEHNWEKIKTLVPDTTYKYLQQKKI